MVISSTTCLHILPSFQISYKSLVFLKCTRFFFLKALTTGDQSLDRKSLSDESKVGGITRNFEGKREERKESITPTPAQAK